MKFSAIRSENQINLSDRFSMEVQLKSLLSVDHLMTSIQILFSFALRHILFRNKCLIVKDCTCVKISWNLTAIYCVCVMS